MKYARRMFLGILVCTSFASMQGHAFQSTSSSTTTHNDPIGEYTILATAKRHGFVLSNNIAYEPTNHHYEKVTRDWNLGDTIRVLHSDSHNRYVLINLRTGTTIKARMLDIISSD